jgi:hypothetical protein
MAMLAVMSTNRNFGRHVHIDTGPRTRSTLTSLMHDLGWMPDAEADSVAGVITPLPPPDLSQPPPVAPTVKEAP